MLTFEKNIGNSQFASKVGSENSLFNGMVVTQDIMWSWFETFPAGFPTDCLLKKMQKKAARLKHSFNLIWGLDHAYAMRI